MSLLKIARMGHPVLRRIAEAGAPGLEIQKIANDMVETMLDASGVGLAAPQVHLPLRLMVFRVPAQGDTSERIVHLLNPVVEAIAPEIETGWEGCLSIPELRGIVPRFHSIRWSGLTPTGVAISENAQGYAARIVQHELDHLNGILYLDRMKDMRLLTYQNHVDDVERDFL